MAVMNTQTGQLGVYETWAVLSSSAWGYSPSSSRKGVPVQGGWQKPPCKGNPSGPSVWVRMWLPATGIFPTMWPSSRADVKLCFVSSRNIHPHPTTDLPLNFSSDEHGPIQNQNSKRGFTSSNPAKQTWLYQFKFWFKTKNSGVALTQQQTDLNPCNHHGSRKYCC